MMRGQLKAAGQQTTAVKLHLLDARLALTKLANETSKMEGDLWAKVVAVKVSPNVGKAHVKCLESECVMEVMQRKQLLVKCLEMSQTVSQQLVECEKSFQGLL